MTIVIAALSFLAGVGVMGALAYRVFTRMDMARQSDPLEQPPNAHVRRLRDAVRDQLHGWRCFDCRLDGQSPENVREALHFLRNWSNGSAVWIVKDGMLTLQNGGSVPVRVLAQHLEQTLLASYKALDEAAALVLDYADLLPLGILDEKGQVLYSRKFAFESEILELARLLNLDPDQNDVARFGGAELWRRQSARLFPAKMLPC